MAKRYINTRTSFKQDEADNWLMMIPAKQVSSDSKIVYFALKKMQYKDGSSQTDSNTWFNITGLDYERVKECFIELEAFGLIELYLSPKDLQANKNSVSVYLLDHFLMKDRYPVMDCPHDGVSVLKPLEQYHILKNTEATRYMKEFREEIEGAKNDKSGELD